MEDPKAIAAEERRRPDTERLLRQFLRLETGLGNSPAFQRGWVFNFEFTDAQRTEVNRLMAEGTPFEDAFDVIAGR